MKNKIEEVFKKITYDKFERLQLIRTANHGNVVMKADISTDGVISYYELWNEFEEKLILMAVVPCSRNLSEEQIELLNPGFDEYRVLQSNDECKWYLLQWLSAQNEYILPPALRNIHTETMSLVDILDWEYEEIRDKYFAAEAL